MKEIVETQYSIGEVVKHKYLDFRGVIYDNTSEIQVFVFYNLAY